MNELSTKQEYDQFKESIFDLVHGFVNEIDVYPADSILAIHKNTYEHKICSSNDLDDNWEAYEISSLLRENEDGNGKEPDIDSVMDLADSYYFVR